jgi:hypothetical protein
MPQVLSFLQLSAGPVPVPQLLDLLEQRVTELRTERCEIPYGPQPEPVESPAEDTPLAPLLDWALHAIASVGALTCADGQATLTPLGSWAVWVKLEQICVAAQSPAGNIEQGAEDMLRGCSQLRPNAARAEYRAWLAARPVGSAVTELLDAARGEDALLRGLAFEALRVVGAPAEPDVRSVDRRGHLRPYALLWLAEHDGHDPEDAHEVLTREEATWLWVDTAAAVADHGEAPLLVRHLESAVQPTVPMLLDEVRAVGPSPHRAGPGRARRRPPRPGPRQGRTPGRLPGAHGGKLGQASGGRLRARFGRAHAAEPHSDTAPGQAGQWCQAVISGAYVPKLQMLPSMSRAM